MAVNINVPSQVKTYANLAAFPASGALKTIYIAEDTNKTYRWTGSVYVEVSASASGITIGTTAITSGVVGRVLFEGAGNVVQESSSLFWDNTNARLGVGTSAPAHTFQVYRNTSAGYLASFNSGATLNTNASLTIRIENANLPSIQGLSPGAGGFNTFAINPLGGNLLIGTTTDAGFRLDVNGTARVQGLTTIRTTGSSYNSPLFVENTGSAAVDNINVATFQGNRGNASTITDNTNVSIWQKNNTVNNYALLSFLNSAGNSAAYIGTQFLNHGSGQNGNLFFGTASSGGISPKMTLFSTGNVGINITTDAGFRLDVNGTARVSGLLSLTDNNGIQFTTGFGNNAGNMISSQGSSTLLVMNRGSRVLKFWNGGSPANQSIQIGYGIDALAPSNLASAIVQIDSTTKGFLPPRMTTTEKNAIASPATGLQVYDTTLNRPCFYDGTTWITL